MKMHELNTNGWNEFPFEVNGVNYVSKVSPKSSFMRQIPFLPEGTFEAMNASAVLELIGQGLSREQIISELYTLNAGASHAVLELAGA
jgi:hypothetical protein